MAMLQRSVLCKSAKQIIPTLSSLHHIQSRDSTAFDPYHYLHYDTVRKQQQESFQRVWNENTGDFKSRLTPEEIEKFDKKVGDLQSFTDFYEKMTNLWSPERHKFIRKTRTWLFCHSAVMNFVNDNASDNNGYISIIFGDNNEFQNKFASKYLYPNDNEMLLSNFSLCDLRYMCACQAVDIYGGPTFLAVFGCRKNYHYSIPDVNEHSAHWMQCMYDERVDLSDMVLISCLTAIKENEKIDQMYFKKKLDSLTNNALKDENWRDHAKEFSLMNTDLFMDKLDRAFVAFQTDEDIVELRPRFETDID